MIRKLRASTVALLFVVACGASGGQASTPLPLPSPPTAALAAWRDFPVNANPRPILWLGGPNLVTAFPGNDSKIAGICNKLILQPGLKLSTSAPAQATATWPSGTAASYRAISAATAFSALLRTGSSADQSMCHGVNPLVIAAVRWGPASVDTDRGAAQVSTWMFQATGVTGEFAYPGLDPSAYWLGGPVASGSAPGVGDRLSSDGRTLTIGLVGSADTPGPCGADYTAAAAESDTAVAVAVKTISHAGGGDVACDLVGYFRTLTVHLVAPLGGRVLVDEKGNVGAVCPQTEC